MSDATHTKLSAEDAELFQKSIDAPAAPTEHATETARQYREMIASGKLVVEDDRDETAAWAKTAFAEIERERSTSAD